MAYQLFTGVVYNTQTGDIHVEPKVIAAKDKDRARDQIVHGLAKEILDDDDVNVVVRPF